MLTVTNQETLRNDYRDYLHDESRLEARSIASLSFPESTEDVISLVKSIKEKKGKITISNGRTGIVGGAVPDEDAHLVSIERITTKPLIGFDGKWFVRIGAGMPLSEMNEYLRKDTYEYVHDLIVSPLEKTRLFFPINPTESTAHIGGIVATNASGARSFHYGAIRNWVRRIRVVLSDGTEVSLTRGENFAHNGFIELPSHKIPIKPIALPAVKNTAGYFLTENMDAIDLFIGSEGTLGIITEVDLWVLPEPKHRLGMVCFMQDEEHVVEFVNAICDSDSVQPIALEYYDANALNFLRKKKEHEGDASGIVTMPDFAAAALFIEHEYATEEEFDRIVEHYDALHRRFGLSLENSWAGSDARTLGQMAIFRHAVPEAINALIAQRRILFPGIIKISSDLAVPREQVGHMLLFYQKLLRENDLQYSIFGHIGDGNVHVNILPQDEEDVEKGLALYRVFAEEAVRCKGTVAAEHGIGRIKKYLLACQFSDDDLRSMRTVKEALDPRLMLNPGVIF